MKVYYTCPNAADPPFVRLYEGLDPKLRRKLAMELLLLATKPGLGEPHVKHFTISKYSRLFELRTKSKIMVRILFAHFEGGILLLEPFVKRHPRDTQSALEASVRLLRQVEGGLCSIAELDINMKTLEVIRK